MIDEALVYTQAQEAYMDDDHFGYRYIYCF